MGAHALQRTARWMVVYHVWVYAAGVCNRVYIVNIVVPICTIGIAFAIGRRTGLEDRYTAGNDNHATQSMCTHRTHVAMPQSGYIGQCKEGGARGRLRWDWARQVRHTKA